MRAAILSAFGEKLGAGKNGELDFLSQLAVKLHPHGAATESDHSLGSARRFHSSSYTEMVRVSRESPPLPSTKSDARDRTEQRVNM